LRASMYATISPPVCSRNQQRYALVS